MRKFALVLVLALALPAAAAARFGDRADGTLVVKNARGQVVVYATGSALGRIDDGTITILDTTPEGSDDIQVLGADRPAKFDKTLGATTWVGHKMRFRIVGGSYVLTIIGKGVNVTAVGTGKVYGTDLRDGLISPDGAVFKPVLGGLLPTPFGRD
jgi:hypothetical protein